MATLEQFLIEGYEHWKRTGRLPNGEIWHPDMVERADKMDEEAIRRGLMGVPVSSFYSELCSKTLITKQAAKEALLHLEKKGHIRINWHHKAGARFYAVRKC